MPDQLHLWGEEPADRLRWSFSRDRRLRDCPRKYYLHHYASRGGGHNDAPKQAREIYVLRTLRNRHMWVGEVVHTLVELALSTWRRGESVPVEALVERGTRRMRAQYAESLQRVYWERPHSAVGLSEHEYREEVSRDEWRAQRDRMEQCLRNFFALPLVAAIRKTPQWRWLALESAGTFEVDGATVMVRPDFAWRAADEQVVLVDWKTGKPHPEDERRQLAVYGIYAQRSWGLRQQTLRGRIVYLATGEVREMELGQGDLDTAEQTIRTSLQRMRRWSAQAGAEGPLPSDFPMTEDLGCCRRCNFRRICGRS